MSFNGSEGATISKNDAQISTTKYRDQFPNTIIAQYMGKDLINAILAQTECVGIRVYKGLNDNDEERFIFVGVDANENDLVDGVLIDESFPSPPYSSVLNVLNGL